MKESVFYVVSSFWAGAVHAATPGHEKTIAAAYLVGVRGKPIDAVILSVFVTLSHTSGIILVGVLGSLGSAWLMAGQMEMYLALAVGVLIIALAFWMLFMQRQLLALALGNVTTPTSVQTVTSDTGLSAIEEDHAHGFGHLHSHDHGHAHPHAHVHSHAHLYAYSHGWEPVCAFAPT
jgi:nickel/cobalt exporter